MAESALSIRRDDLTSAAPAPHDTPVQYELWGLRPTCFN